ncbi:NAD-dependent epimerase/dehydratase family protein [Lysinibacillus sp. NPDC093688]|uniref:NAD-dependent epimerase/dehydratase family protein n=1 Tax=Lysinibacillus sp. NPDC093688 TaxID=3390577 RepID=UPI003D01CD13
MKIFVTGATGVIGKSLIAALVEKGYIVGGMTTSDSKIEVLQALGATAYVGNILEKEQVEAIIQDFQPNIIIHQVTALQHGRVEDNAKVRAIGTRHLVEAAKKTNSKRLIAQSIAWAYEPGDTIAIEETPLDVNAIGRRKITIDGIVALESAIQEIPDSVILRYGSLYGPGTWYDSQGLIAQQYLRGEMVVNDGITSFIHIEDAVKATIEAIDWEPGIYNIADDEPVKNSVWGRYYAEQLKASPPKYIDGKDQWERGAFNQKAKEAGLHLRFPSWRKGFIMEE